ncbi:MAG: hypothetical protein ABIN36_05655 [Ferruginibacter sp.]
MKKWSKIIVAVIFMAISSPLHAQNYFRGEQTVIQPLQVMIDNYTAINLVKDVANDPNANRFDKYNPYTFLQLIYDSYRKDYQVLFQTNFSGKILFLAYSNNLSAIFNNREKPFNVFANCIRDVNDHLSPVQNMEAAIKCIIDRLNYCSE